MKKDFIEKNKLTMEEKNRLNTIYGTGTTHCCYADTDSLKVAVDNAKCEYEPVLKTGIYPINSNSISKFQAQVIERLIARDKLTDINTDDINIHELEVFIDTFLAVREMFLHYNYSRAMEVVTMYIDELEKMYYLNDELEVSRLADKIK